MSCRWDREAEDYLTPSGDPCRHDDQGDPTRHCTARKTCAQHIYDRELTCPRCVGRTRATIKRIADLAALMYPQALASGVNSEAASLAGPAADVEAWSWRKITAAQGRAWHLSLVEDDDEFHPYTVLTRWEFMLREDYKQPRDTPTSVGEAAAYLDRVLHRVANDEWQDFPLLSRELRKCRNHLEATIRNSLAAERGAPCPECTSDKTGVGPRLVRHYGHWCLDPDCENIHYADDSGDTWVCPQSAEHWWTPSGYADLLKERAESRRITAV